MLNQFFILVLSIGLQPDTVQSWRADIITEEGYSDSVVVKRADNGFKVFEVTEEGKEKEVAMIYPVNGKASTFACRPLGEGEEKTVDLASSIKEFNVDKLRDGNKLAIELADGTEVHINRSGAVTYINAPKRKRLFVIH